VDKKVVKKAPTQKQPPIEFSPRIQIYDYIQPRIAIEDQGRKCAGCYVKFSVFSSVRWCEYTGQWYCRNCRQNDAAVIPARVLHNWDIKEYKVSKEAKVYLDMIYQQPLFDISSINPQLYLKVRSLRKMKILRQQLTRTREYVTQCPNRDYLEGLITHRLHFMFSTEYYSVKDTVDLARGFLSDEISEIIETIVVHILKCKTCKTKNYKCSICESKKHIFPFQLSVVVHCPGCKNYYHRDCYSKLGCTICKISTLADYHIK